MKKSLYGVIALLVACVFLFCSVIFTQSIGIAYATTENELIGFLKDPNPLVRLEVATMLGYEYLIEALKDESMLVRYFAAKRFLESMAGGNEPRVKNALLEAMEKDKPIIALMIASGYQDTKTLMRLYKDKKNNHRKEAFQALLAYFTEQEQMELITNAVYDSDTKIRLLSVLVLRVLKENNAEAQRLYDKVSEKDPLIKRFLRYLEYLKTKETIMEASVAFNDSNTKLCEIFVFYLLKTYDETMDESLVQLIYEGTKSSNVTIRLTVAAVLITYEKYMNEARGIFTQSLETFIGNKNEEFAFSALLTLEDLPEGAIPDTVVLTKIFNDERPLVRWGLIQLIREIVYYKRSAPNKQKELESFLSDKDPLLKLISNK